MSRIQENGGAVEILNFDEGRDDLTLGGDFFCVGETRGAFVDACHLLTEGDIRLETGDSVETLRAGNRILVGSMTCFRPELLHESLDEVIGKRRRQLLKFRVPDNLPENTARALWKACSQLRTQFCTPEGIIKRLWTTPDRWPHRRMWLWDSVFHAIGIRHLDVGAAREVISAVLECAREDGFIPLDATPEEINRVTQPPLLALGVKLVQEIEADRQWLLECYPKLKGYVEWDLRHRDSDGSELLEWHIEADENCRSGESGMDNSPRFDAATQLKATDFNAFVSSECEILADFAEELGFPEDAALWRERHEGINRLINAKLWNDGNKFYFDYDISRNRMSDVMASAGFLPLICGAPSRKQAVALAAHLNNPDTFKTAFPVASVAICDKEHYDKDMWRGPVWININWLIASGLRRYGLNSEADALAAQTMAQQEKMYLKYGTFFEFYDDRDEVEPPALLRKGRNQPNSFFQAFHDFGWSATLYIDFVFGSHPRQG